MEAFPDSFNMKQCEQDIKTVVNSNPEVKAARKYIMETAEKAIKNNQEYFVINLSKYSLFTKMAVLEELIIRFPYIGFNDAKLECYNSVLKKVNFSLQHSASPDVRGLMIDVVNVYTVCLTEEYGRTLPYYTWPDGCRRTPLNPRSRL